MNMTLILHDPKDTSQQPYLPAKPLRFSAATIHFVLCCLLKFRCYCCGLWTVVECGVWSLVESGVEWSIGQTRVLFSLFTDPSYSVHGLVASGRWEWSVKFDWAALDILVIATKDVTLTM
ncbi:hypothetical protein PoB_000996600 [Plakobranchus ocellatus]|uniref:Uncharacterized protein n=1 Tax=Plakobranchus ocellatus TaxID=259542 RepID=A0AAV3YJN5_9GAST|nr:hypothetical protein PoB_000996600 [Plakobranchus ocellatus]